MSSSLLLVNYIICCFTEWEEAYKIVGFRRLNKSQFIPYILLGAEPLVFQFAIQKFGDQDI
jgi:hypothetical protein